MERSRQTLREKAALRTELRARLDGLSPEERSGAAERIARRLLELPEIRRAKRIFTCLSFGAEPDTWALVEGFLAEGREVFVPRAESAGQLSVCPYPCPLETLSFGLRQPVAEAPTLDPAEVDSTLDVALVLGLGFDRQGNRLGYGRGYFDRFLAGRPFPAVGVAFSCQLLDRLPAEPHDVPMAVVVTEGEVVRPARR